MYASRQEAAEKARAAASLAAERLKEYVASLAATQPVIAPAEGAISAEEAAPPEGNPVTVSVVDGTSLAGMAQANHLDSAVIPAPAPLAAPVVV